MRRVVSKPGVRRSATGTTATAVDNVPLDDQPLSLVRTRDGKRLIVVLPYELWVIQAATFALETTIDLPMAAPSVWESDEEGILWIGGQHLHRGNFFTGTASKIGSKLGGFVDHICLIRPNVLCTVGTQGELLWDVAKEDAIHRRKVSERHVYGLVASPDGRAVWTEGRSHAWIIDPEHLSGYTMLRLKATSAGDQPQESIVCLGQTTEGRVIIAARDGAIGWTNRALRLEAERYPNTSRKTSLPLAVTGDDRWVYVVRPGGTLQRFLIAQPKAPATTKGSAPASGTRPSNPPAPEVEPLPEAQTVRLRQQATCIAMLTEGKLALAGPQAEGQLGQLWHEDPETLPWEPLAMRPRTLVEPQPPAAPEGPKVPNFERTRNKVTGPALRELKVDDVLAGPAFWITRDQGTLLERPTAVVTTEDVLPNDALVLPAMFRFEEGTARPGLIVWPGAPADRPVGAPVRLTWGREPRGWIPLDTPHIRAQGWTRRDVFPLQVALRQPPPEVAGHRPALPQRWVDAELFEALAKECKRLLKVLW